MHRRAMNPTIATEGPRMDRLGSRWLTGRRAFIFLAVYFSLQVLFRVLVSDSAELDESHQLLCVQEWRWGYGSDPPLYTWLQRAVFAVFGANVLSLALLKNGLLFSAFAFTYAGAKAITRDDRVSVLAMLSLFLFPQITWESQRDLTHSVLATALAAATFWAAVKVSKSKAALDYALLGLCVGLGTLSKYSYCLFALALGIGALTVPRFRALLLNRKLLLSIAVFGAVVFFHFQWVWLTPELAWKRPQELIRSSDHRVIMSRVLGVMSVAKCALMVGGVISAVYLALFLRRGPVKPKGDFRDERLWMRRTLVNVLVICLGIALWLGIELKDRWFQPVVFLVAITAALLVRERLTPASERRFFLLVGTVGSVVLILLPGIPLAASITGRPTRLNAPFSALSAQLAVDEGRPAVIVAGDRLVGGNLKLNFPDSFIISPEFRARPVTDTRWLVVWDASKSKEPPQKLEVLIRELRGTDLRSLQPAYLEAHCKYTRMKTMKLGYVNLLAERARPRTAGH